MNNLGSFLNSMIRLAIPLTMAAICNVFPARAGIVNVGLEGFMLTGALFGVIGSYLAGSALIGATFALFSGLALSIVFSYFTINLYANQTVMGTALNMFAAGLTITLNRIVFGVSMNVPKISVYNKISIPLLSDIPVIGESLFNIPLLGYVAFFAVPIAHYIMNKTRLGLNIRSVGENPVACDSVGINVRKLRWGTMLFGGSMAALAGSYMSLGNLSYFVEDMVAGQGFMVLAIIVMGSYTPIGVFFASLLFGASQALQYRMQGLATNIPYQFLNMIPYLITILAVSGLMRVKQQPSASGIAFRKE